MNGKLETNPDVHQDFKLEDFIIRNQYELDTDCRVWWRDRKGRLHDATGSYKSENADRIFFHKCRVYFVNKSQLVKLEEV